jgi:sec-independent protein translocase protein TatC
MAEADLAGGGAAGFVPVAPPAAAAAPPAEGSVMPLVDHLAELRRRIIFSLLAVGLGSIAGFVFGPHIIDVLKAPYGDAPLLLLAPGDGLFITLKVAVATGIVLGMPVILYQIWRFVSPGLTPEERRLARPWVPMALAFFAAGVAIAYVVLPYAIGFLSGFGTGELQNAWTASGYFGFVTTMFVGFGLVMQYPVALVLLSKVGIVTSARLRAGRRYTILVIAVIAAVATPGGDIISPVVLGVAMYGLYELTIALVRAGGR